VLELRNLASWLLKASTDHLQGVKWSGSPELQGSGAENLAWDCLVWGLGHRRGDDQWALQPAPEEALDQGLAYLPPGPLPLRLIGLRPVQT
jgi:hypothetical protein